MAKKRKAKQANRRKDERHDDKFFENAHTRYIKKKSEN